MRDWMARDKVVLVSGASKGIGFGVASALVERGARVTLLARDPHRLQAAVRSLDSDRAIGIAVDVCDKVALERAYAQSWEHWGRLDGVVNNVGYQFTRRIEIMPEDEVRKLVELNYLSTVFSCQIATGHLRRNGGGRIINISSSSVRDPGEFAHIGVYTSCKAAVDQFTSELRREVMADNITVTLFSSGGVLTASVDKYDPDAVAEAYQAWLENGNYYGGATTPEVMGAAIAQCFEYPPGIAAEFIEVRSGVLTPKELEPGSEDPKS